MPTVSEPDWLKSLFEKIKNAGFPLYGAVDLDTLDPAIFDPHVKRFETWIQNNNHGEMGYLERGLDRRKNPKLLMSEAKTLISIAIPYRRSAPVTQSGLKYARYLQGPDYHKEIPKILEPILSNFKHPELKTDFKYKICVDTSAVLERSWASICGLGWIGKNTLLINPTWGSYLFLAEILINQSSGVLPKNHKNYCGHCTRCLDACPTRAFLEPHLLDSKKCISYLTLEKRGEHATDTPIKQMGAWIAGCDVCQEVCPFNLKPSKMPESWPEDLDGILLTELMQLDQETKDTYKNRVKNSSLSRVKFEDFKRNLSIAEKNIKKEPEN